MNIQFNPCSVMHGERLGRGYSLRCGSCRSEGRVPVNTMRYTGSEEDAVAARVRRKFEALGWVVGRREADHRCPACVRKARKSKLLTEGAPMNNTVVKLPQQVPIESQSPPQLSRSDRRVIFAKLEETYADEVTGYRDGWTDQTVATDLGVPLAWIKTVREENFGPCASNPDIDKAIGEARAVRTDMANLATAAAALKAQCDKLLAECAAMGHRGEMVERKLTSIQKIVGR